MSKIIVLYWEPGSCGDFVHSTLLHATQEYKGIPSKFRIESSGRVVPVEVRPFIKENFSCIDNLWYELNWTTDGADKLSEYLNENHITQFVIPTHRYDQVEVIKSKFDEVVTIGITYPVNMFPLVLKNWCKKVAAKDPILQKLYDNQAHQTLIKNGVFGEYMLSEQLKFGSNIRNSVDECFDVNICLEDLFNQDLTKVKQLFMDSSHIDYMFNGWFKQQSTLHKYHYGIPDALKQALGFNSRAVIEGSLDTELDIFDNILINHYTGTKHSYTFKTLDQATNFFKDY
jgi:hypothetical protein